jgi:hypothetical protein
MITIMIVIAIMIRGRCRLFDSCRAVVIAEVLAEVSAAIAKKPQTNYHNQTAKNEVQGAIVITHHFGLLDRCPGQVRRRRSLAQGE